MDAEAWEYRQIVASRETQLSTEELNALGRDGWEAVGLAGVPDRHQILYLLKRRLGPPPSGNGRRA